MSDFPLPVEFVNRIKNDEFIDADALMLSMESDTPSSIRLNPLKSKSELPFKSPINWCSNAFFLNERPSYVRDPLFHAGAYYPQEAGSMYLERILNQLILPDLPRILDLCAAPGGKSTLIAAWLKGQGMLVSNEVIHQRSKILKENMVKWGAENTFVSSNDTSDFKALKSYFDVVVVDAPCSGEGMFRKDPASRAHWSEDNVSNCVVRQQKILSDSWECIQPGGYLIYSTCTLNQFENEENVKWAADNLAAEIVPIDKGEFQEGREGIGYYAFPNLLDTEGFFIALLQKKNTERDLFVARKNIKSEVVVIKDKTLLADAGLDSNALYYSWKDFVFTADQCLLEDVKLLHSYLHLSKMGTEIGQFSRKGLIPNESLALAPGIHKKHWQHIELFLEQALSYLKGETFPLEGIKGFALVCYKNEPLGWINHLGNRFNNLYPKDWRIRMRLH
jgi:16S rRNA C967 or C1407 C5-methylase (RsmB/RsmF family)/NOL1/NOP2/fmu family ribosome biogenesis protein